MNKEELEKSLNFANEERERLQDRIDKAIEYIKNCQLGCDFAYRPLMLEDTPSGEDLLNILRGKDNE